MNKNIRLTERCLQGDMYRCVYFLVKWKLLLCLWIVILNLSQGLPCLSFFMQLFKLDAKQLSNSRTYFFLFLSSSLSEIRFFSVVDFDTELPKGEGDRLPRCLLRGERERDRLLRFLLGERDLLLLRCLRSSLSCLGILDCSQNRENSTSYFLIFARSNVV